MDFGRSLRVRAHRTRLADTTPPLPPAVSAQQRLRAAAVVTVGRADATEHEHRRRTFVRSSPCACGSGTPSTIPTCDGDQTDVLDISTDGGEVVNAQPVLRRQRRDRHPCPRRRGDPGCHLARTAALLLRAAVPERGRRVHAAVADGTGTITITNVPRGDTSKPQTLNVPNWPSSTHAISVVFTDFPVE